MKSSRLIGALACLFIAAIPMADHASADEVSVPVFWDAKERLTQQDLSDLPRLRFLTTTDFPPFNYLDDSGRLSGFHVDLARAICMELAVGDRCQIQAMPWNELEAALAKGDGEAIIAGLAVTSQARARYAFSRSYLRFPGRFIINRTKGIDEPIFDHLQGKPVGVLAASAHAQFLSDHFGGVQIKSYDGPERLLADLKAGTIDAAFGDGMRLAFFLAGSDSSNCCRFAGGPYIAPAYFGNGLALATTPDNQRLAAAFDAALQQLTAKGIFAELYLRYFPVGFY